MAEKIAAAILPIVAHKLMATPTFWGDKNRAHISPDSIVVNALFNLSSGDVFIEDYVIFGHNVTILTGTHAIDKFDTHRWDDIPLTGRDVHIERGVWVCSNATIIGPLPGGAGCGDSPSAAL